MAKSPIALLYDHVGSRFMKYVQDGTESLLGVAAKLRNAAGTVVNPSTEDTLATRASESTLSTADGRLATIDSVLDSIKDTDGIKKITDALPAGTNEIGKVAQGTKAAGSGAWPQVLYDASGNPVGVTLENGVYRLEAISEIRDSSGVVINPAEDESLQCVVDAGNSSTGQLGNGGTFVGTGVDCLSFASVAVTVHSDQDSATDGMKFQFSMDNSNWDDSYAWNLDASQSDTRRFQFPVTARYFRVNYTNGITPTTEFRCQTLLHRQNLLTSIHRLGDCASADRSAQVVKAALIAQREGVAEGQFCAIKSDISGNLKVTTIGSDIPSDPTDFVLRFLEKSGGGWDLLVDGSTTPVAFYAGPTVTDEIWSLREVLLIFTADDFSFDGVSFGPNLALTNGIKVEITHKGLTTEVFNVQRNEDFIRVPGRLPLVNNTGPKDILGATFVFDGLILYEADSDKVTITIRDDLTSTKLKYLTATVFAVKVE